MSLLVLTTGGSAVFVYAAVIGTDRAGLGTVAVSLAFSLSAMTLWGYAFWAGIPATFALLAARSRYPEERAGDAQALMAAGRVLGPTVGGAMLAAGSLAVLGLAAASLMATAALVITWIEVRVPAVEPAPWITTGEAEAATTRADHPSPALRPT